MTALGRNGVPKVPFLVNANLISLCLKKVNPHYAGLLSISIECEGINLQRFLQDRARQWHQSQRQQNYQS